MSLKNIIEKCNIKIGTKDEDTGRNVVGGEVRKTTETDGGHEERGGKELE